MGRRDVAARRLACLAGLLLAMARTAGAEDLLALYGEAQARDPVYLAARYSLEATEQRLPQARAGLLPSLSLGAGESRQRGQASFSEAPYEDREVTSRNWSLQLTQPLFRPANWSAFRQADAQLRQAQAQFRQAGQDLMLRTAQAYFETAVAQESLAVAGAQLEAVDQQWQLARRNFEVGMATITDVHEARSRRDLARAQKIAAGNELTGRLAELERIIGRLPGRLAGLAADAPLPPPEPAGVDPWIERAAAEHPAVAAQEANLESLEQEVARQRSGHLPTVDVNASYGNSFASGSMTSPTDVPVRSRSGQVGVQFNLPLWSGGAASARVAEAQANLGKARADLEAARRQAAIQARQAHSGIVTGLAQVEALASAVESSAESLEANRVGYRIGTRINIDVLNAQQQLYTARRDLARAKGEALLHGLRLKAAVGALDESDIVAINRLLADSRGAP